MLWRFAGGEDCEALNHRAEETSDTSDGSPLYHRLSVYQFNRILSTQQLYDIFFCSVHDVIILSRHHRQEVKVEKKKYWLGAQDQRRAGTGPADAK